MIASKWRKVQNNDFILAVKFIIKQTLVALPYSCILKNAAVYVFKKICHFKIHTYDRENVFNNIDHFH